MSAFVENILKIPELTTNHSTQQLVADIGNSKPRLSFRYFERNAFPVFWFCFLYLPQQRDG